MSKSFDTDARFHLPAAPGALAKSTVRMCVYFLCATIMLLDRRPLSYWQPGEVLWFLTAGALLVPALGIASNKLRGATLRPAATSIAHTLTLAGVIVSEFLVVSLAVLGLDRVLF